MLDIKQIRENTKEIQQKLQTRDPNIELSYLVALDQYRRDLQTIVDELKAKQKQISKEFYELKQLKPELFTEAERQHDND